ncbi:PAS domain-containing protein [Rheinheimera sediminis]|uniref:sensor histidine kinase n=1 Tax=Rheinheimera sp. YQF-1 TaxID=2499626 RepID=UPI000FD73121|nr:ATP-binding protein [Rheinheimera sp. YQF-1]RVT49109.1 PAS domain-containing protein [Rheinheimera sp. YQF-1]
MIDDKLALQLIRQLPIGACLVSTDYTILLWNDFFSERLQLVPEQALGKNLLELFPEQSKFLKRKLDSVLVLKNTSFSYWEQRPHIFHFKSSRPVTGHEELMYQNMEILPITNTAGDVSYLFIAIMDATTTASYSLALKQALSQLEEEHKAQAELIRKLEEAHNQLLQAEKMASIGQLAAGVAHEINNPIGFISSNMETLQHYCESLIQAINFAGSLISQSNSAELSKQFADFGKQRNLNFLLQDMPELITESLEGTGRVMSIVKSLREFSHVDSSEWKETNLIDGIESTLRIINNELKYKAEVHKNYQKDMPLVYCQSMQINQVFMNILLNAAQAMEQMGFIYIDIATEGDFAKVSIRDTGPGIEVQHLNKIFDPFFTTKAVGAGTGLGLSLSYSIVQKHKGKISVQSQIGQGAEFTILLPLHQQHEEQPEADSSVENIL